MSKLSPHAVGCSLLVAWAACISTGRAATLPDPDALPSITELPNPFIFADGSKVQTKEDWQRRRTELRELILGYEYGHAPAPSPVTAKETSSKVDDATGATEKEITLTTGPDGKIQINLILTIPKGDGPFPAIVKGDLCWKRIKPEIVAEVVKRGYILAEFDRTVLAPDAKDTIGGIRAVYTDSDCGALAAWAWGFHRVNDYLLTRPDVDAKRLINTGHSRGGKAALLAGALDERVALTAPNGSGCGGAGCYRVTPPDAESIAAILKNFPYWFSPGFGRFIGKVDHLPFDQHDVKALVAPRLLLSTEGAGDLWANPHGTQQTFWAAKEVYKFLGAENNIAVHWREGKHEHNLEDFQALLDFADMTLRDKKNDHKFNNIRFPDEPKAFSWSAPASK